ncbi:hypothetical protein [Actinoplanes sp. NPDC020271]|uniref:hypothetical protein n=1 Tax=Actinoplanes sp. NPDC020271 TaxID=3363896 RepID=UPI00379C3F6F
MRGQVRGGLREAVQVSGSAAVNMVRSFGNTQVGGLVGRALAGHAAGSGGRQEVEAAGQRMQHSAVPRGGTRGPKPGTRPRDEVDPDDALDAPSHENERRKKIPDDIADAMGDGLEDLDDMNDYASSIIDGATTQTRASVPVRASAIPQSLRVRTRRTVSTPGAPTP